MADSPPPSSLAPPAPPGCDDGRAALERGGFDLIAEIGRGGMGIVYRARERDLDREVAVKVLRESASAAGFAREAHITGRLEHPDIPPVHAFEGGEPGRPFLAMKLVRGLPWSALIAPKDDAERARAAAAREEETPSRPSQLKAPLDLHAHLEILRRVCDAVAFAHTQGVVHCDLKPDNVMIGAFGEVLVMDWGIAVEVARPAPERDAASQGANQTSGATPPPGSGPAFLEPSQPMGTPAYMAPEMARGQRGLIGPWTDVYLLGGILYKLLTGTGPHAVGGTLSDVFASAVEGHVEHPSHRAPDRTIDEGLALIALRALEAEPGERFASPVDLARAIEDHERSASSLALAHSGARHAEQALAAARAGALPAEVYGRFGAAIAELTEAGLGWKSPPPSVKRVADVRLGLVTYAVRSGDLALAEAEAAKIAAGDPAAASARAVIEEERQRRRATGRRRRAVAIAGALLMALVGAFALREWTIAQRFEAARLRRAEAEAVLSVASWNEFDAKVASAERATAIDPTWPGAWAALGRIHANDDSMATLSRGVDLTRTLRAYRSAALAFERAIALGAADAATIADAGYARANMNDWPAARAHYVRAAALAATGTSVVAIDAAGVVALADGRFAEAEERFARCIALEAGGFFRYEHAISLLALGRLEEAAAEADRALAEDRASEAYAFAVILSRLARGRPREVGSALLETLPRNDDSPHLLGLLGVHAARQGDEPRARAAFARAQAARQRLATVCGDEPWYACLARTGGEVGRLGKAAMQMIGPEAFLSPEAAPSLRARRLAEEALARGDATAALGQATLALAADPADGAAYLVRGRALTALGQREGALEDLRRADVFAVERAEEAAAALAEAQK